MQDERNSHSDNPALTRLRVKLNDALAYSRTMDRKDLPAQSGLGRTTVWGALQTGEPVPSAKTVAALARVLKLPVDELLELRRDAAGEGDQGPGERVRPGRPIGEWDPHTLEVHPAGPGTMILDSGTPGAEALPGYVERAHDLVLADAVRDAAAGRSRMLVLVGTSSTGKTRACWEAVQPLADAGWRLWHPIDPTPAEAALNGLQRVGPRTVVWLNEAQHYLGDRKAGERIAAALQTLLTVPERGPVLVLGTLWPVHADRYTALPSPAKRDRHSRVRELLSGRMLTIPDTFDAQALATAFAKAQGGDLLLADALTRAGTHGRVAQDLAGVPELLKRYELATPAARAVLEAAMDARRLGVGLHLPQAFLTHATADYLTDTEYDQLTKVKNWAGRAYAELAKEVHGKEAPLRSSTPRTQRRPPAPSQPVGNPTPSAAGPMFRLADYLEQHGRATREALCPPASFWHAAHTHLTHPDDLNNLAQAAEGRHRLQWAHHLRQRAGYHGNAGALYRLAMMREEAGDGAGAEALLRQAADHGNTDALVDLAERRKEAGDGAGAKALYRQAADHSDDTGTLNLAMLRQSTGNRESAEALYRQVADHGNAAALYPLALLREEAGDGAGAEALARRAADHGDTQALIDLAKRREKAGDGAGAEALARRAADHGDTQALIDLAMMREEAGDEAGAEALYRRAADHGDTQALVRLAMMREEAGDEAGAEALAQRAADYGSTAALICLAERREEAGDREGAEALYRQAADHGNIAAMFRLAMMREEAGDGADAEALARQAADHGKILAMYGLAMRREEAGDGAGAEALYRQVADYGNTDALIRLAERREEAGDEAGAEALYRQAADHGNIDALYGPATLREQSGDREGAEALYRRAADHGNTQALVRLAMMREEAGDEAGAEALARQAADHGNTQALVDLAKRREEAGDRKSAEALLRQAADHGHTWFAQQIFERLWPYGLDPDGTHTLAWQP